MSIDNNYKWEIWYKTDTNDEILLGTSDTAGRHAVVESAINSGIVKHPRDASSIRFHLVKK